MDSSKKYINLSPESTTNICSKLLFCWVVPFFRYGYKHDLEVKDVYNTEEVDLSGPLGDALETHWQEEVKKAAESKKRPSLKTAIYKTFYKPYGAYGILLLMKVIIRSLQPIALSAYLEYLDENTERYEIGPMVMTRAQTGWFLGAVLLLLGYFNIWIQHIFAAGIQRIGMRVRIASCSLVYRKLLRLSQASIGQTAAGQIVNLLSNDVQRFDAASLYLHYIWLMPIQFALAFYIMFRSVGVATFAGMIVISLEAIPLQGYLSKLQGQLRFKIAQRTDYRVKLMSEIVAGIQVIKMYAWEKPFEKVVELARKLEIKYIARTSYIRGFSSALMVFTERVTLYFTIVTYVLLGNRLTSGVVFSMAQLINTIQATMCSHYPTALSTYAESKVTIRRLEDFLIMEENTDLAVSRNDKRDEEKPGPIKLEHANASWLPNAMVNTLIDINLRIKSGVLCCVVGHVGSGKSSLLQLLLKELPLNSGKMEVHGKISYASQEPWLFVSNVRNNILFGQPFLKTRYDNVVKVCALERDFKQFPYGDKTMVGERGVSLSGGQRARINLARAIYTDADIYLFDDPLSAVDTHVAKHLFEKCFKEYLGTKTRILATHQLQFLKQADMVVVINNGRIENVGTYEDLSEKLLKSRKIQDSEDLKNKVEKEKANRKDMLQSTTSLASVSGQDEDDPQETQELMEKGSISGSLYLEYFGNGATVFVLVILVLLLIVAQLSSNACDLWITRWTIAEEHTISIRKATTENVNFLPNTLTTTFPSQSFEDSLYPNVLNTTNGTFTEKAFIGLQENYIIVYTFFIIASIVLTTVRSLLFYNICIKASTALHNKMFSNVLKSPMRFFDTNPSGRILNRFSKDIGGADEILPKAFMDALQIFLVMSGILMMVFLVTPWMILVATVLGSLYYYIKVIYQATAQDLKRIEGITRAPVFSHISATLYGIPTIRSSNAEDMVIQEFDALQDQHTGSWFLFMLCSEAFGFYLDCLSVVFLAIVIFQFLILNNGSSVSGNAGLVISSSIILTSMLQAGIRQAAEVASNMTSVERIVQYTNLKKEEELNPVPSKIPDRDWPHSGKITFKNTYLRYALEEPPVLKNLNIVIEPGEKVGIVGRTGAGKSTLIASLFRLAPLEGTVAVDDVDTSTISLECLRSNISIIPQEPILFSATIRYNLDPFEKVSDDVIWKALENVELKSSIDSLDQKVSEGGSNFSVGQRQLICLARAIVRNNKVLVMDEATANVDQHTDSLIQKTIRENFRDCTVLTVAHRLNTIMDSDKVLVMDIGEAVEYDHPHRLLQNPDGYFFKMVAQTGKTMEEQLRRIAAETYHRNLADISIKKPELK